MLAAVSDRSQFFLFTGRSLAVRFRRSDGSPLVGKVSRSKTGKTVTEFLGIPYAEPPVGELRFRLPRPKSPWKLPLNVTRYSKSCLQTPDSYFKGFSGAEMWNPNTPLDEDCLYLNVWVPGRLDAKRKLPVMVWIYGGGFWSGTSSLDVYDGKILASEENVILVSMNYRVSVFGFLYVGLQEAPGNAGLLDQLEAVKWVQRNIRTFGGDPDLITGSATSPWGMETQQTLLERALLISEACNCSVTIRDPNPDFAALVRCLKQVPAEKLLENEWVTYEFLDFPWTPVVDHYFLMEDPRSMLQAGNFKRTELLVGSNMDESVYFIVYYVDKIFKKDDFFTKEEFLTSNELFEQAAFMLLPHKLRKNPIAYRWALDKMLGDYYFTCHANEFAKSYYQHGSQVYYYYFTHRSSQQTWPKWMGVLHGYEINFLYGEPLNTVDYSYTESEKQLSRRFMRYWANFGRKGDVCCQDGSLTILPTPYPHLGY
ncbi:unnamed protein product [Soboliphyme baturini]|uniref:acetylcholinesterase n=1 Tax=Soboliphyme baturini TaxID=241478 RepID=A0A3P8CXQ5_9BILA|nr:unnamed protein product [Soboliphyme baturini]